ncbi:MAG TPA: glycosyltransferase family 39 protein [Pyrinomonadaceae bacterium]|jgi:hypothetical protein
MAPSYPQATTALDQNHSRIDVLLLVFCSSFFALYNSNAAYTSDEVWSINTAHLNYSGLMTALKADVHPPLYFQLLHGWVRLFGTGEQAVRGLSGLFYIFAVLALYRLAKDLYGENTALLCAALYACSPLAILSAQFARMYSLLSLLSILSTWLFVHFATERRNTLPPIALYVAINVLGTFTHIAFFFTLFGQIVFQVLYRRAQLKRFAVAIVLSVIPYLILWAPVLLGQIGNSAEGLAWVKKPRLSMLTDVLLLYGGVLWLLLPIALYLSWRRGFKFWKEFGSNPLPPLLLVFTIVPPVLISIIKPVFNSRLAIVGLHLFALTVCPLLKRTAAGYVLALLLVVLTGCFMVVVHPSSEACDNRALAMYLVQNARDNDVAIFTSLTRMPVDYYFDQTGSKKLVKISFPAEIDDHPGYEGRISDPANRPTLEREARELVDRIGSMQSTNPTLRVFFFHGLHPEIDAILEKELQTRFEVLQDQEVHCTEGSPYLKTISVYRVQAH